MVVAIVMLLSSTASYAHKDILAGARITTLADTGELQYDIKYVKFNLSVTNASTAISGDVSTTAIVTASSMSTYVFELTDSLTIDSVKINGTLLSVSTTAPSTRKVNLVSALPMGSSFTAQVFYHGNCPLGAGFFTRGVSQSTLGTGTKIMYTCGDPNWCSDWWPCKQVLSDKIDSVDMWVTVPTGVVATSNGLKLSATNVTGGVQYHWSTHYLIDYYLIVINAAPYVEFDSYIHYTGSTDSTPLQNFFYDTAGFVGPYKKNFDSAALMVDYLSQLYGRYPYDKEKFGYSYSTLNGGMENQTLVTIGVTQTPLIAHELGHQWFGDHVTYASWRDIWLSEGFACYTEQLFVEHFWGEATAIKYRTSQYSNVVSTSNGSVYVDDTTSVTRIFDGRLTYYKGAACAHMLRYIAPSDSVYFHMLRTYQNTYAFGLATTTDLKNIAVTEYGKNLDTFFNQWIYGQGYPIYKAKWNYKDSVAYVLLAQTASDSSVTPLFYTPLEIQLLSPAGDTTIKIYNDKPSQLFSFKWNRAMNSIKIDPNNNILHKIATFGITYDPTVGIAVVNLPRIHVYPNPAKEEWNITGLPTGTNMLLTDINGRTVWQHISNGNDTIIPAKNLVPGNYYLKLSGTIDTVEKLVRP